MNMIHFEIVDSPDPNVKTFFKYFKNEIYLGKQGQDLSIDDPALMSSHVLIEVPEKDLLIHPQKGVEYYLLNGKRTTSIRKLKLNDIITIGNTVIKIIEFKLTDSPSRKKILTDKLNQLIEQNSARLSVIEKVSRLVK